MFTARDSYTEGVDNSGSIGNIIKVYKNNSGTWSQVGTDVSASSGADFTSVFISDDGNLLIAGSASDGNSGVVRVHKKIDDNWVLIDSISGVYEGDGIGLKPTSGYSQGARIGVSSDGTIIAIGNSNPSDINDGKGYVRVYKLE